MKKIYKITMAILLVFVLFGCGENSKKDSNNSLAISDEVLEIQRETDGAWELVNDSFDKLKTVPITATGVHTELAHITFADKDDGTNDYTKMNATYEQCLFNVTIGDIQNARFEIYSLMEIIDKNILGIYEYTFSTEDLTIENLRKNHFASMELRKPYVYAVENGILKENDEVVEVSEAQNEDEYLDYLTCFKKSTGDFPAFLKRGITRIRLIPDAYYEGEIEEIDKGKKVVFTFDQDTNKFKEKMKQFNSQYGTGTSYGATDDYVICEKGDEGAEPYEATDFEGNSKTLYRRPGIKEEFVSAKIEIELDKEGYPVKYVRESLFDYKEQNVQIPYRVEYTFNRK